MFKSEAARVCVSLINKHRMRSFRRASIAIALCIGSILLITGCNRLSLTKRQAEELVRKTYALPTTITGDVYIGRFIPEGSYIFRDRSFYKRLKELGYVSVKEIDYEVTGAGYTVPGLDVSLTDKGKAAVVEAQEQGHKGARPVMLNKLLLYKADVEIGDIRIQDAIAEIDYRMRFSEVQDAALGKLFDSKTDPTKPGPWCKAKARLSTGNWEIDK